MPEYIDFDKNIQVRLRRVPRARHLRLSIDAGGRVLLTRPVWVSQKAALSFLAEKRSWLEEQWQKFSLRPDSYLNRGGREEYLKYKEKARSLVMERLLYFNQFYSFRYGRISVRDQHSRWGSCSKKGNLNFNYRLVLLPPELADYVILHELCHLGEFNHSPDFWRLLARKMPDYAERRKSLRQGHIS